MITEPNEFMQKLQELQDSSSVTYSTLPSNEPRFIIDANSRTIKIPPEFQFLGVKNDHNAETVYFEIDRYFDDEDLSQHTCVVQFSNKNNSNDGGIYPVTTMDTTSVDGKIIFGWEIKSDATSIVGDIYFSVRFYSINSTDYVFTYNFNTLTAKSVILDTLDVDNQMIIENYPSELDAWTAKMNELSRGTEGKVEEVQQVSAEAIAEVNAVKESIPADYTTLSNNVSELKSDIDYQVVVDYSNYIINGYYIDGQGNITKSNSGYNTIAMLPVHGFSKIKFENIALSTDRWGIAGFNSNKEFVKQIDSNSKNYYIQTETCSISDDICYVSFCYYTGDSNTPTITCDGIKNIIYKNEERINSIENSFYKYFNIIDKCKHEIGSYYNNSGKQEQGGYEAFTIECSNLDDIKISTNANSVAQCLCFYSGVPSQTTFISYVPYTYPANYETSHIKDLKLTIPQNTKYIVLNNKRNDGEPPKIEKLLPNFNGGYENKNFLMLGDSITAFDMLDNGWVKYFKEKTNANRIDNTAVVGCHWRDYNSTTVYNGNPLPVGDEQNVIGNQIQKIINNRSDYLDDYDYIFIACGTNDEISSGELTVEEVNSAFFTSDGYKPIDNVDRSTWAGATRYAVEKLRELFPSAKIVFNTPINRMDFRTYERVYYNDKIVRQCSEITSVLLCDTVHCGISMNDSSDFVDNLHPSVKGAKKLGYYIANWFISNCNY